MSIRKTEELSAELQQNNVDESSRTQSKQNKKDRKAANDHKKHLVELNGPKGPEPTRYGDWESKGRCYDF